MKEENAAIAPRSHFAGAYDIVSLHTDNLTSKKKPSASGYIYFAKRSVSPLTYNVTSGKTQIGNKVILTEITY